mmetsp:Transcript_122766/g.393215  ORF Transcript_122766/g.393215 Transcript_122766/m.393215 type:complete len:236 (+) Transcript_122766:1261-1968(+)
MKRLGFWIVQRHRSHRQPVARRRPREGRLKQVLLWRKDCRTAPDGHVSRNRRSRGGRSLLRAARLQVPASATCFGLTTSRDIKTEHQPASRWCARRCGCVSFRWASGRARDTPKARAKTRGSRCSRCLPRVGFGLCPFRSFEVRRRFQDLHRLYQFFLCFASTGSQVARCDRHSCSGSWVRACAPSDCTEFCPRTHMEIMQLCVCTVMTRTRNDSLRYKTRRRCCTPCASRDDVR